MSHSREKQCNDFSLEIFGKGFNSLDQEKRLFVFLHVKEYEKYRDTIKKALTFFFQLKGGSQFQIIREWYYKRIPIWIILQSIDQCLQYLLTSGKPLLSLRYFEPEINYRFLEMKRNSFVNPQKTIEEKWLWPEYQSWKAEKSTSAIFDLFEGLIPG